MQVISELNGTLSFAPTVLNRLAGFDDQDFYTFWLDTDRNASTPASPNAVRGSEIALTLDGLFDGAFLAFVFDEDMDDYLPTGLPGEVSYGAGPIVEIPFRAYGLAFGDRINFSLESDTDTDDEDFAPGETSTYSFQIRRCDLEGTRGDDRLTSGARGHWICGFRGDDRLRGRGGDDLIYGGRGADRIQGGPGVDVLEGGRGGDSIRAGPGADYVYVRGGGADRVRCGPGFDSGEADANDRLIGCEDFLIP